MVTRQPQVERRTAKVRLSETDVLPLWVDVDETWHVYSMGLAEDTTSRKWNFELRPLMIDPERGDYYTVTPLLEVATF